CCPLWGIMSVSSKLGVKAMPTFFLIKDKEVVNKIVGANPDEVKKMSPLVIIAL
ncbi:hypothetical protein E2562_016782, partial [Oryza meyeriana var. granulata]